MPLVLRRYLETTQGTIGQFTLENGRTLYSMERRSSGDHPRIPAGIHEMRLDEYHAGHYPAYEIIIEGRSRILIHAANRAAELLGCIAPGKMLGFMAGELAVLQSRMALTALMESLEGAQQDYITIHDPEAA